MLVGYVGRLAPEKEVERLAEPASVPEPVSSSSETGRLARRSGRRSPRRLPPRQDGPNRSPVFLGARHGDDLARATPAWTCSFTPGPARRTFGQTIREAGATGLPVVALRVGGPVDLVTDGVNGYLFDPSRPGALRRGGMPGARLAGARSIAGPARSRASTRVARVDRLVEHYEFVLLSAPWAAREGWLASRQREQPRPTSRSTQSNRVNDSPGAAVTLECATAPDQ